MKSFKEIFSDRRIYIRLVLCTVLVGSVWFALRPFIPAVQLVLNKQTSPEVFTESYYQEKYGFSADAATTFRVNVAESLVGDRLIIPSIGIDIELIGGEDQNKALSKGAWVVPGSVRPGDVGEMVITGHRFEVLPPAKNTFYNLDKMVSGDVFIVIFDGYAYRYQVRSTEVVNPEDYNIGTRDVTGSEITLYTCTPLWTATQRLLQHGELVPFN